MSESNRWLEPKTILVAAATYMMRMAGEQIACQSACAPLPSAVCYLRGCNAPVPDAACATYAHGHGGVWRRGGLLAGELRHWDAQPGAALHRASVQPGGQALLSDPRG